MYLQHFKLTSQPFAEHAPTLALWQDQRYGRRPGPAAVPGGNGTLGLLTGVSGVGKSALLKRFLHGLPKQHCEAIYCHLTHLPSAGILKTLVTQLGEVPRHGKDRLFQQVLERAARIDGTLLLVFDEAHLLDSDALTDLRLLISSALDAAPPLKILLAGQEPLRTVLRQSRHADLLNRVSVRYQLHPLTKDQTAGYLDFQVTQAGGSEKLFDDSVKAAIHDFTAACPGRSTTWPPPVSCRPPPER